MRSREDKVKLQVKITRGGGGGITSRHYKGGLQMENTSEDYKWGLQVGIKNGNYTRGCGDLSSPSEK